MTLTIYDPKQKQNFFRTHWRSVLSRSAKQTGKLGTFIILLLWYNIYDTGKKHGDRLLEVFTDVLPKKILDETTATIKARCTNKKMLCAYATRYITEHKSDIQAEMLKRFPNDSLPPWAQKLLNRELSNALDRFTLTAKIIHSNTRLIAPNTRLIAPPDNTRLIAAPGIEDDMVQTLQNGRVPDGWGDFLWDKGSKIFERVVAGSPEDIEKEALALTQQFTRDIQNSVLPVLEREFQALPAAGEYEISRAHDLSYLSTTYILFPLFVALIFINFVRMKRGPVNRRRLHFNKSKRRKSKRRKSKRRKSKRRKSKRRKSKRRKSKCKSKRRKSKCKSKRKSKRN